MGNKIYQYGAALPPEVCDDVIVELTRMMEIEFDKKSITMQCTLLGIYLA